MSEVALFLDNIINPYTQLVFYTGDGNVVTGFINEEFSISGSSSFNTPMDNITGQEGLSNALNAARSMSNWSGSGDTSINRKVVGGSKFSQVQIKSLMQTISSWSGCAKPTFTINFVFISYRPSINVLDDVKKLLKGVYPKKKSSFLLGAPYDYGVEGTKAFNTCSVRVSKWFYARGMVLTSVSSKMSKETNKDGKPLYATVDVNFEPYRMVDVNEVMSWFRG